MNTREYFRTIQDVILDTPYVLQSNLNFDEISKSECYIKGILTLSEGIELHIAEYVVTKPDIQRLKYRYHLQRFDNEFLARWDNAPHHSEIETHPNHLHLSQDQVKSSLKMNIEKVLLAVLPFLDDRSNT